MNYRCFFVWLTAVALAGLVSAQEPAELQAAHKIMDEARQQRDPVLREKLLGEAKQLLTAFAQAQPDNTHVFQARQQIGNIFLGRARAQMKTPATARGHFEQAESVFKSAEADLVAKLTAIPKALDAKRDIALIERRDQFRADYLQVLLLLALLKEETAETYPQGDPEAVKLLEEAAKRFGEYYEKYRTRIAGLYGRFYQARVLQKLGKHKESLALVTEYLLPQPDQPAPFRTLKIKAMLQAIPSWRAQGDLATAVDKGVDLVDSANITEKHSAETQELRYHVAGLLKDRCDELRKAVPREEAELKRLEDLGRRFCAELLKSPNEWHEEARRMFPQP